MMKHRLFSVVMLVAIAFMASLVLTGRMRNADEVGAQNRPSTPATINTPAPVSSAQTLPDFSRIAERTIPAVVNISSQQTIRQDYISPLDLFYGRRGIRSQRGVSNAIGSGVIVSPGERVLISNLTIEVGTLAETVGAVLYSEPDWGDVPDRVQPLLRRCLEKHRHRRSQTAAEVRSGLANPAPRRRQLLWPRPLPAAAAVAGVIAAAGMLAAYVEHAPPLFSCCAPIERHHRDDFRSVGILFADQPFNLVVERNGDPTQEQYRYIAGAALKLRKIALRDAGQLRERLARDALTRARRAEADVLLPVVTQRHREGAGAQERPERVGVAGGEPLMNLWAKGQRRVLPAGIGGDGGWGDITDPRNPVRVAEVVERAAVDEHRRGALLELGGERGALAVLFP